VFKKTKIATAPGIGLILEPVHNNHQGSPVRSDGALRRNAARIFGQAYEYAPRQMPQYHSSRDVYASYSRLANNNLNADARRHRRRYNNNVILSGFYPVHNNHHQGTPVRSDGGLRRKRYHPYHYLYLNTDVNRHYNNEVIFAGRYLGADPDPGVRLNLRVDRPNR
jgi:hypothetical protein